MYFVYILKSLSGNHTYVGQTDNLSRRIVEHNSGKMKSTKAFIPWEIIYTEEFVTREEAVAREKYLKSGGGRRFRNKILSFR